MEWDCRQYGVQGWHLIILITIIGSSGLCEGEAMLEDFTPVSN